MEECCMSRLGKGFTVLEDRCLWLCQLSQGMWPLFWGQQWATERFLADELHSQVYILRRVIQDEKWVQETSFKTYNNISESWWNLELNILAVGMEGSGYSRNSWFDRCREWRSYSGEAQLWGSKHIRHVMSTCWIEPKYLVNYYIKGLLRRTSVCRMALF